MGNAIGRTARVLEIPGIASVVPGNGGLQKVSVNCAACTGEIYLHGAHVTSWKPAGREDVFFVSAKSRWEHGRAIRGGVPICFPWFGDKTGDPKAPAHGFARTREWQLDSLTAAEDGVTVSMSLVSDDETKPFWSADFRLVHRITFASELTLELELTNTGTSPLRFEEALHAYHRVGDVQKIRLAGLDAVQYLDKTEANVKKTQHGDIAIVSETDRVYLNTAGAVELEDPVFRRRTRVAKGNSFTTVVWNPWVQKAHSMADLGDDEWTEMICIETSNVSDFVVDVAPGAQHTMTARVSVTHG
jgi:glucose-6-phosphate 1-epimerase